MYLAFVVLLSFRCDAPFKVLFNIEQLRCSLPKAKQRVAHLYSGISLWTLSLKLFFVCFGLPSANKKFLTYSLASLAMTKTLWGRGISQICRAFVIARPLYKNTFNLSSIRPKQSMSTSKTQTKR